MNSQNTPETENKKSGAYLVARYEIAINRGLSLAQAGKILDELYAAAAKMENQNPKET